MTGEYGVQHFFAGLISNWDSARRSGPEFSDPSRGQYLITEVPLTPDAIAADPAPPSPF